MNIYMDDQRPIPYGFTGTTCVEEALQLVRNHAVHILSLDYNMGWRRRNGLDFVEVFCKEGLCADEIHIHTDDPIGRRYMLERLLQAKRDGEIDVDIKIK